MADEVRKVSIREKDDYVAWQRARNKRKCKANQQIIDNVMLNEQTLKILVQKFLCGLPIINDFLFRR